MFQTNKVIPTIYKYKLNKRRDRAQHNRSENALLERGKKKAQPSQNEPWGGFARTATYVHHWAPCAQTGPDPGLRQQAAGAYQLPRKPDTDPPLMTSYLTQVSPTGSLPRHRVRLRGLHTEQRALLKAAAQKQFTAHCWFEARFHIIPPSLSQIKLCASVARQIQKFWTQFWAF